MSSETDHNGQSGVAVEKKNKAAATQYVSGHYAQ